MDTRQHRPDPAGARPLTGPPAAAGSVNLAAVLRTLLLGALVFVAAAVMGGLLAGAAPAGEQPATAARPPAAAADPVEAQQSQVGTGGTDARLLGLSMVYAGAGALTVSVIGTVIVLRRRRLW